MQVDIHSAIDIGIDEKDRKEIAERLSHLLANTYTLYVKTHGFHWNVTGNQFESLHELFEKQYIDLAAAADLIAERIRALGFYAPGSFQEFNELSSIEESKGPLPAEEMIQLLVKGNETVARTAREMVELVENANDQATLDLLTERMGIHEKSAWMLRSSLND